MLSVDISFEQAIKFLAEQVESPVLRKAVKDIDSNLESLGIADAVEETKMFPEMLVSFIRAGLEKASIDKVLEGVVWYYELRKEMREEIVKTLVQPVIALAGCIIFIYFSVMKQAPQTESMIKGFNSPIPPILQFELSINHFVNEHSTMLGIAIIGAIFGLVAARGIISTAFEKVSRSLPLIGRVLLIGDMSLAARMFSIMFMTGTPGKKNLDYMATLFGNTKYGREFKNASESYTSKADIVTAVENHVSFDKEFKFALKIGMKASGKLIAAMDKLTNAYAKKARRKIEGIKNTIQVSSLLAGGLTVGSLILIDFILKAKVLDSALKYTH